MSGEASSFAARIARIDALRSRLGLLAVACALVAVSMAALGLAAEGPLRILAFVILGVGGLCVVARLRLAWQRVQLARAAATEDALHRARGTHP